MNVLEKFNYACALINAQYSDMLDFILQDNELSLQELEIVCDYFRLLYLDKSKEIRESI